MFMCIQFSYIWVDKKKGNLSLKFYYNNENNCTFDIAFFFYVRQNDYCVVSLDFIVLLCSVSVCLVLYKVLTYLFLRFQLSFVLFENFIERNSFDPSLQKFKNGSIVSGFNPHTNSKVFLKLTIHL